MKTLFIVYAALILCQPANGQVSGSFLTVNEKPVVGASVQLIRSTDTIILKSGITDEKGKFSLAGIGNGKYFITASGIGVESWRSQIFELTTSLQSIDLGRQVLTENKKTLDAVVVRGSKPFISQTPYGTVLNVAGDILTKGSTVLQLLERSPGVVIDYRNGDIFLNGKSGVMIMLNGKLVRMPVSQLTSMLNGISANDISSIELLTSPPSG